MVQEAFSPSEERVEWATGLITAFERHQESGQVRREGGTEGGREGGRESGGGKKNCFVHYVYSYSSIHLWHLL